MSYRLTETEVDGGFDLHIKTDNGYVLPDGATELTVQLRKEYGPRLGERVIVDGKLIKVAERRHDSKLWLKDEDTGIWYPWARVIDERTPEV